MRALVVDDHADIAEMLARMARHLGHAAEAVSNPLEAIARAGEGWDVVVTDYGMRPNGLEVLRAFHAQVPETFRVLVTAGRLGSGIRRASDAGLAHLTLQKPVSLADVSGIFDAASARQ